MARRMLSLELCTLICHCTMASCKAAFQQDFRPGKIQSPQAMYQKAERSHSSSSVAPKMCIRLRSKLQLRCWPMTCYEDKGTWAIPQSTIPPHAAISRLLWLRKTIIRDEWDEMANLCSRTSAGTDLHKDFCSEILLDASCTGALLWWLLPGLPIHLICELCNSGRETGLGGLFVVWSVAFFALIEVM